MKAQRIMGVVGSKGEAHLGEVAAVSDSYDTEAAAPGSETQKRPEKPRCHRNGINFLILTITAACGVNISSPGSGQSGIFNLE